MLGNVRLGAFLACVLAGSIARADIVVTLEAADADGPVSGPVAPGSELFVDVLLSVTPDDDPLAELRSIQLDTRATPEGLAISAYEWRLDELGAGGNYFEEPDPPIVRANHVSGQSLTLTVEPVRVGRFTITADKTGRFDLTGGDVADPNREDDGLRFSTGVEAPREFSVFAGDVRGGTLDIEVGPPGNENDNGNGGNKNDNGNPPDGNENMNTPPRDRNVGPLAEFKLCGFGMLGSMLVGLAGLVVMRVARGGSRTPSSQRPDDPARGG